MIIAVCLIIETIPIYAYNNAEKEEKEAAEKKALLCGYNVTGGKELFSSDSLQTNTKIIDPEKEYLGKKYLDNIVKDEKSDQIVSYCESSNLKDVSLEYANAVSAGLFGKVFVVDTDLTATFNTNRSIKNAVQERYEVWSMCIYEYYYVSNWEPEEVVNFLDDKFVSKIKSITNITDAKNVIKTYGTHLITGYFYGGRLDVTNHTRTESLDTKIFEGERLDAKMKTAIGNVTAGGNMSLAEDFYSYENTKQTTSTYNFRKYGGNSIGAMTVDQLFTYNPSLMDGAGGYVFKQWTDSLDAGEKLNIVGIPNGAYCIPLWELVDNKIENAGNIKQLLKEAYVELSDSSYDDYMKKIIEDKSVVVTPTPDSSLTLLGADIKTKNGYYYYVEESDFGNGTHDFLQNGETIYLDYVTKNKTDKVTFKPDGCKPINLSQGIFEVDGTTEVVIKAYLNDNTEPSFVFRNKINEGIFEGGTGDEKYPYIITTTSQFEKIALNRRASYILFSDLDFNGRSISCMGDFNGTLDGNYCELKNFKISSCKEWGLFRNNYGTIKNLKISNAGSSKDEKGFVANGINYRLDFQNSDYNSKENSIMAQSAGIICAVNKKEIDNCYLENVYIRNIIKENKDYAQNNALIMSVGAIAGVNDGKISNCMVKGTRLLGSFIHMDNTLNGEVSVYVGGITGSVNNGKINSCVVDMTSSSIMSQNYNWFNQNNPDFESSCIFRSFSGGLIGYCIDKIEIDNSLIYVKSTENQGGYKSIDSEYFTKNPGEPKIKNALRCATIICSNGCEVNSSDRNIAVCSDETLKEELKIEGIIPTSNGDNFSNANSIKRLNNIFFNGENESDFELLANRTNSYIYKNYLSLRVQHILQRPRKDYMKLRIVYRSENDNIREHYEGQFFVPDDIVIKRSFDSKNEEELNIYNLRISDSEGNNAINKKLEYGMDYRIEVGLFDGEVTTNNSYMLSIKKNDIIGINVVEDEENPLVIYYDSIDKYEDEWKDVLNIELVYSDGHRESVNEHPEIKDKLNISFRAAESMLGQHLDTVYGTINNKPLSDDYVIEVKNRKVTKLSIVNLPEFDFFEGDKVDYSRLNGLILEVEFDVGDKKTLQSVDDLKLLEVTGDTIAKGKNHVILSYMDYKNTVALEIEGKEKMIEPTDPPTSTPPISTSPSPDPDPSVTPLPEPTPTDIPDPPVPPPEPPIFEKVLKVLGIVLGVAVIIGGSYLIVKNIKGKKSSEEKSVRGKEKEKEDKNVNPYSYKLEKPEDVVNEDENIEKKDDDEPENM